MTRPQDFMLRALELARAQMGRTWPNPSVGCVLVSDDTIVGEGATGDGGRPHAEERALDAAGHRAAGATAYVTLEPCGARSTGQPSCSERLLAAGVSRVIYACTDPSPLASHLGPARLKAAGIEVEHGLLEADCAVLIEGWVHFLATGRPIVLESETAKGFDGELAPTDGDELAAELRRLGAQGLRRLYVPARSQLAKALAAQGLLGAQSQS